MFNIKSTMLFRPSILLTVALSAMALTGCVAEDMALDDGFVPYTVDQRYPLVYQNGHIVRKPCGQWTENLADTASNQRFTNHGCAIRANMAAMIANPRDIETPNPISPSLAPGQVQAVKKISNGQSSATSSSGRSFFSFF